MRIAVYTNLTILNSQDQESNFIPNKPTEPIADHPATPHILTRTPISQNQAPRKKASKHFQPLQQSDLSFLLSACYILARRRMIPSKSVLKRTKQLLLARGSRVIHHYRGGKAGVRVACRSFHVGCLAKWREQRHALK